MTATVVAGLMWLLVACLLVLRRRRVERGITYASLTIAVSMTLNIDPVYLTLDGLAGGTNFVTLVADLALMTGVFLLGRGVMKASDSPPRLARIALSRIVYLAAVLGATTAFLMIDRGTTTTNFMLDLGAQRAAAAYSIIHFSYYAVVLAAMAVVAGRQARVSRGVEAVPSLLLVIGAALGIALAATVVVMDLAHVVGNLTLMSTAAVAYSPLFLLAFFALCLGFAGQPATRALQARSRKQTTHELSRRLAPAWRAALSVRPGMSQNADAAFDAENPETLLHRQVVEIRDAMIDTRVAYELADSDRDVLESAERHLVRAESTSFGSSKLRA
ncbi:hypothetical protein J7E25_05530 [Agromyces sp. ISL-38]|uniref:DUF6545 domain-containing protein n=1 Tax=Agromyces sp. ISL-38 TaxID=2819107 RepID=UPI001BE5B12F|nr:DUF6545 domain-containing protein [Agromyces sp. ISL-38]MBT2498550.1 hypothetical protein [Agromyces sp. ISL-38]